MKERDDTVYLKHILDAVARIEEYLSGVDQETFVKTPLLQDGYHTKMTIFCCQVRPNKEIGQKELDEKIELCQIHNRLRSLSSTNFYNCKVFRNKVQSIVGKWLNNDQIRNMQVSENSGCQTITSDAWESFNSDYEEVKRLIEKEARKYIG